MYILGYLFLSLVIPKAFANTIQMHPVIDLAKAAVKNSNWHKPQANPKGNRQYYITNSKGQLYLIDHNEIVKTELLSVIKYYPELLTFNQFVLHPNFSLPQQKGYNTFYTAHVEPTNKKILTLRIKDKSLTQAFPYEVALVEWQINEVNPLKIKPESKREILRIGISSPDKAIVEMRFNPYIKSWNDNFSHLYIALQQDESLKQSALYSGAVLRINPEKFGLRGYTVPNDNPFIKQADLPNELLIVGAQQIKQFIWQKNNDQQLIISHLFDTQSHISKVNYGENLLAGAPLKSLLTGDIVIAPESLTLYRGREFKNLRNSLIFVSKKAQGWQLQSLEIDAPYQLSTISAFANSDIALQDKFSLFIDHNEELLLFLKEQNVIQQLKKNSKLNSNSQEVSPIHNSSQEAHESSSNTGYFIFFLLLIGAAAVWFFKQKKGQQAVKSLLHKNYARFVVSDDKRQILLFQRHQEEVAITLDISHLVRADISLNNELLLSIEAELSGFNAEIEQLFDKKVAEESRIKMVDNRTRKLELTLTDDNNVAYGLCLYLREGNQRLTKAKFEQITDELKDWCWLFSSVVSPEKTGKRAIKIVQPEPIKTRTVVRKPKSENIPSPLSNKVSRQSQTANVTQQPLPKIDTSDKEINNSSVDTQLINALGKLADLKAQGFLTDDEFITAKAKILADLQKS
ncbi:MAG: hypothetical protein ACPG46_03345 [Thalassotalea sp.]